MVFPPAGAVMRNEGRLPAQPGHAARALVLAVSAAVLAPAAAQAQDLNNGREVYGPCAACHGANGEGGKGGEYPRLAGQTPAYILAQLKAFQDRKRLNLPMFPYTEPRELPPADMVDVATYVAGISLPARAPVFKETDGALDRLRAMEQVLVVPRVKGDLNRGERLYLRSCADCHGRYGVAPGNHPNLVGQYPNYLDRQMVDMAKGVRLHERTAVSKDVVTALTATDRRDILAYLTSVQDRVPEPGGK